MSVRKAVERDLALLPGGAAKGGLAALALALADQIDDPSTSSTSKSMNARVLRDALEDLRRIAPAKREKDGIDDLSERRVARRRAVAAGQ